MYTEIYKMHKQADVASTMMGMAGPNADAGYLHNTRAQVKTPGADWAIRGHLLNALNLPSKLKKAWNEYSNPLFWKELGRYWATLPKFLDAREGLGQMKKPRNWLAGVGGLMDIGRYIVDPNSRVSKSYAGRLIDTTPTVEGSRPGAALGGAAAVASWPSVFLAGAKSHILPQKTNAVATRSRNMSDMLGRAAEQAQKRLTTTARPQAALPPGKTPKMLDATIPLGSIPLRDITDTVQRFKHSSLGHSGKRVLSNAEIVKKLTGLNMLPPLVGSDLGLGLDKEIYRPHWKRSFYGKDMFGFPYATQQNGRIYAPFTGLDAQGPFWNNRLRPYLGLIPQTAGITTDSTMPASELAKSIYNTYTAKDPLASRWPFSTDPKLLPPGMLQPLADQLPLVTGFNGLPKVFYRAPGKTSIHPAN